MTNRNRSELCREEDIEFFERELASFLPDKVFDAHAHLWHPDHMDRPRIPAEADYHQYMQLMDDIHPGRTTGALFIPFPVNRKLLAKANQWHARNAAIDDRCRSLFIVTPDDDPQWVRQEATRLGAVGLKCYHTYSSVTPTWHAHIPDYLPEPLVALANDQGWVITLHMVRDRSVADPANIHWIRHYCESYPNMKLILAHSARALNPSHGLEGLPQLTGLDNLYFDTSASFEATSIQALIRIMGHEHVMYGTDCPLSHGRGRCLAAADSFVWLYEHTRVWEQPQATIKPVLAGLEQLRALKWACWSERLDDNTVEDIFYNNAATLFELA